MIKIEDKGFVKAEKLLKAGAKSPTAEAVLKVANFFETQAKKNLQKSVYASPKSPHYFRTGKARQSIINSKINNLTYRVFMGVNYGKYLEEGTGIYRGRTGWWTTWGGVLPKAIWMNGMKARPFWKPTEDETRKEAPIIIQKVLNKYLTKFNVKS